MSNSTAAAESTKPQKPEKPNKRFPLYAHASGKWCKVIKGKMFYFGRWNDPYGALREYEKHIKKGAPVKYDGATIEDVCIEFMRYKFNELEAEEISPQTVVDCQVCCRILERHLGKDQPVEALTEDDFDKLKKGLSKEYKAKTELKLINRIHAMFRIAVVKRVIPKLPDFGLLFKPPRRKKIRLEADAKEQKHGKRIFTVDQVRQLLAAADPTMKAMITLALNSGFGNSDIARLPVSAVDLETGWIDFPRPKTAVRRRIPLWPETRQLLADVINNRPKAANAVDGNLVFLTADGMPWIEFKMSEHEKAKAISHDFISKQFDKLLNSLSIKRLGLSFYSLRHVAATVASDACDLGAVAALLGHADRSITGGYIAGVDDARLVKVVNHVATWLYASEPADTASAD